MTPRWSASSTTWSIRSASIAHEGVIIDVAALDVLDSFGSRTLRQIAEMARLRGASTVIVGIQPDVALAMVQLGMGTGSVPTALDLEEGLDYLNSRIGHTRSSPSRGPDLTP